MGEQPMLVGGRSEPAPVLAMQVMDDLGQNLTVAEWIHHNGGRLSDPMTSMDCAFTLYVGDGPERAPSIAVQIGDVIAMVQHGVFVVLREVRPVTVPEVEAEVPATLASLGAAIDGAVVELAARSGVPLELLSPRLAGADRHPWFMQPGDRIRVATGPGTAREVELDVTDGVATLRPAVPQEGPT